MTENEIHGFAYDPKPLVPVDEEGLDSVAESMLDSASYILLPERNHGGYYSYPDCLVAVDKTCFGKSWHDAHKYLHDSDSSMLTPRQFVDFLNLLASGKARDSGGRFIGEKRTRAILEDILLERDPWKAEWLDAEFKERDGVFHVAYDHKYVDGKLTPQQSEPIIEHLRANKTGEVLLIDRSYWVRNANRQGLPTYNTAQGGMLYWPPEDGKVACAWASNVRGAGLSCSHHPSTADEALGVRRVKPRV